MPIGSDELEPLLRLALVQGVGPRRLARLVDLFGSAERILATPQRSLRGVPGLGPELARRIADADSPAARKKTQRALARLKTLGARVLTPTDRFYPHPFKDLAEPPFLLFALGEPKMLAEPIVAIVGTRSPTIYGRKAAAELSSELALSGYVIASGLARGIDTAAHLGALEVGGGTIGVLGHGIEQTYPRENAPLFARVRHSGLLITEYPPGETPKPGNFPRRNRLITALAEAVVVVEMGHRSGAQHTVTYALEQGKEVMAVPGPIGTPANEGTNQLIKDGARLVTCAADVVEELRGVGYHHPVGNAAGPLDTPGPQGQPQGDRVGHGSVPGPSALSAGGRAGLGSRTPAGQSLPLMTRSEERILAVLSSLPVHIDEVVAEAGMPAGEALATLLQLELRGLARSMPGKCFARDGARLQGVEEVSRG